MKKIFFKGYYGFKNLGDDLYVNIAAYICQNFLKVTPYFVGSNLPKLYFKAKTIQIKNRWICRCIELILCFRLDYIVFFGGSTLGWSNNKFHLQNVINEIPYLNHKVSTIGTSIIVTKDETNKYKLMKYLKKLQFIAVRDIKTKNYLEQMSLKPKFSFDPAIILSDVFPELCKVKRKEGILGICVCLNREESYISVKKRFNLFLEQVLTKCDILHVYIIQFNGMSLEDEMLCMEIADICKRKNKDSFYFRYSEDSLELCKTISNCSMIFGSRLHSGIIAYALNIPFMLEEYHEKCTDFLDTINHMLRYDKNNLELSVYNFIKIWKEKKVEELISPDSFKKNFYNTIECYKELNQL